MCTPNGTKSGRRVRTAGVALVVLSALALLVGLVVTGLRSEKHTGATGQHPAHAARPPATSAPAPSPVVPYPPPAPSRPAPAPAAPPPAAESTPSGTSASSAPSENTQASSGASFPHVEVRVYNNGTIRGLAARVARDLTAGGWTVSEVGNYARGIIPTSTVYYQEGTGQRAAAEALAAQFKMRAEPRFPGIADASPGLIVIITNDYESS